MTKDRSRHIAVVSALTLFILGVVPSVAAAAVAPLAQDSPLSIAVKFVALRPNEAAAPPASRQDLEKLVNKMSQLWSPCNLRFVLEEYVAPLAAEHDVPFHPGSPSDRYLLRQRFSDQRRATYIVTGKWDRARDPSDNGSNAFSSVPGDGPQAIVLEDWVSRSHRLLSHEFGHLGGDLDDTSGPLDLMNHVVGAGNTQLSPLQCEQVVAAIKRHNTAWLR